MIRFLTLSIASICLAGSAVAAPRCNEPYAPQIPSGATATREEILAAKSDAAAFMAASDIYQECLARRGSTNDSLFDANQRDKERVSRSFNAALAAFNKHNETLKLSSR